MLVTTCLDDLEGCEDANWSLNFQYEIVKWVNEVFVEKKIRSASRGVIYKLRQDLPPQSIKTPWCCYISPNSFCYRGSTEILSLWIFLKIFVSHSLSRFSKWMFPKIGGKLPKWMVYNGQPYFLMDDLGGKHPHFWFNTQVLPEFSLVFGIPPQQQHHFRGPAASGGTHGTSCHGTLSEAGGWIGSYRHRWCAASPSFSTDLFFVSVHYMTI